MSLLEELESLGVNVEEAKNRLMGSVPLYEKMLGKFADMLNNSAVSPDFDSNDYQDIIEKAHAIKGASGNLSITPVYEAYTKIVDLLRKEHPEEAKEVLREVLPIQAEILECIKKHRA